MMVKKARNIVKLGNPILRQVCQRVRDPKGRETATVVNDLFQILQASPGWGLAAPQIGYSTNVFIMAAPRSLPGIATIGSIDYPQSWVKPKQFTAIINPVILGVSDEMDAEHEMCLSAPDIAALVPRHVWVDARFKTIDGKEHIHRFHDHPARVFQHEFDHLEGIMFLDRILDTSDIFLWSELQRQLEENEYVEAHEEFEEEETTDHDQRNEEQPESEDGLDHPESCYL